MSKSEIFEGPNSTLAQAFRKCIETYFCDAVVCMPPEWLNKPGELERCRRLVRDTIDRSGGDIRYLQEFITIRQDKLGMVQIFAYTEVRKA